MSLRIEYVKAHYGWIEMILHSEDASFAIDISEVYDPFEDWFFMLERVYRHNIPSLIINPEGRPYRIDIIFNVWKDFVYEFNLYDHHSNQILFSCITTREEIVEQMYGQLMAFVRSDRYDPKEYEPHAENSHSCAFPLKHYRNEILENYLLGLDFYHAMTFSKCLYCNQEIVVKTIDDMLQRAYALIDANSAMTQLLEDLYLDKYSIGITQEYSRLKKIERPHRSLNKDYRDIQGTESGIFLGFNENFTQLEVVEVMPHLFTTHHIRGWKARFNTISHDEKMRWLESVFSRFSSNLKGMSDFFEVHYSEAMDDTTILLKLPNEHISENRADAFYPNTNEYPYFSCSIDHERKNGMLKKIHLQLCDPEETQEPLSHWLSQNTVSMYPDHGEVCFWFDGTAGDIESFEEEFDFEHTYKELKEKLKEWYGNKFDEITSSKNPDWDSYNKEGRALHQELQEVVKSKYILAYYKSFEETHGGNPLLVDKE